MAFIEIRIEGADAAIDRYRRLAASCQKGTEKVLAKSAAQIERDLIRRLSAATGLDEPFLEKRIQMVIRGNSAYLRVDPKPIPVHKFSHRWVVTGRNPTQATTFAKTSLTGSYLRQAGFTNPRGRLRMPLVREGRDIRIAFGPSAQALIETLLDPRTQQRIADEMAAQLLEEIEKSA